MSISPLVRDLLINGVMAGTAVRTAKKTSLGVAYYATAGGIACLGFVFLAVAGNAYLMESFPAHIAAAMTGSIILLIALCVGLWGHFSLQRKKLVRKPAIHDGGLLDTVEGTLKSLMSGFEEPVKDNPKMALLMAALAGFAAGDQLGDRMH